MPTNNNVGERFLLEPTHGVQALLEMPLVALHSIVEILRCPMLNVREHGAEGRG